MKKLILLILLNITILSINQVQAQKGNVILDDVATNVEVNTDSLFFQYSARTGYGDDTCMVLELRSKMNPKAQRLGGGVVYPYTADGSQLVDHIKLCFDEGYLDSLLYPIHVAFIDSLQAYGGWDTIIPYNK